MPSENRETVRVYTPDKKFIAERAENHGISQADVVADMVESHTDSEHRYRCPECDGTFILDEVDMETVENKSRMEAAWDTDAIYLIQDRNRPVKSFECPRCGKPVTPEELGLDSELSDAENESDKE